MNKTHQLISFITILILAASGTVIAGEKGKGKAHGPGGVSEEHISEQGAAHRQYNAGGVSDQHKHIKDKEKDLKEHKEKKEKKEKKIKEKYEKEMKEKHEEHDHDDKEKTNRRWWQFFGGGDE